MPSSHPPTHCHRCKRQAFTMPRGNDLVCVDCYLADAPAVNEIRNRTVRVFKFAELLSRCGITAEAACGMSSQQWADVSRVANLNPPSLETQAAIVASLEAVAVEVSHA
jgi:hypothetical protein